MSKTEFEIRILDDSLQDAFFHFTDQENLSSINEKGLNPVIGKHSNKIEESEKVFFSKGFEGVLQNCDVWLKWLMNKAYGQADRFHFYRGKNPDEVKEKQRKWDYEFRRRLYIHDYEKLAPFFERIYQGMKKQKYLILDLEENVDFKYDDIDEPKKRANENKKKDPIAYLYAKEMYGDFSNFGIYTMDSWNMHTLKNHGVERKKIYQLMTKDKKDDMVSIVSEIYKNYKNPNVQYDMLDSFMNFVKRKQEEYKKEASSSSIHMKTINLPFLNSSMIINKNQFSPTKQEEKNDLKSMFVDSQKKDQSNDSTLKASPNAKGFISVVMLTIIIAICITIGYFLYQLVA